MAELRLEPGAVVTIGPGVVTERRAGALRIFAGAGSRIEIEADVWLRTDLSPVVLATGPGARLRVGAGSFLNGCHLSAKESLRLGRRVFVGPGSRILDADQHELDDDHAERIAPVWIGDHAWIAADVTVLRGVKVGEHAVVGTRSVVTRDVPPFALTHGQPARAQRPVGSRFRAR